MKLNVVALAIAGAVLWGAGVFFVGLANMAVPDYGGMFLSMVAAIYPGYQPGSGFGSLLIGTAYALVDGAVGGALFGWLYNIVTVSTRERAGRSAVGHPAEHQYGRHAR